MSGSLRLPPMSSSSKTHLSVLSLAAISSEGTIASAFENMVRIAQAAEKFGYERFWIAEHHNIPSVTSAATAVLIGHVAQLTSKIRVGSGGIMLPNHAPLIVAENFGTLATLYPGRIDLGLGRAPGTDPLTSRALRRDLKTNGEDFPDLVEELEAFLAPAVSGQRIRAVPGAGIDVPLWILGSSLFSADFAARKGLPYAFAAHFAPRDLMDAVQIYRSRFVPSVKHPEPYMIVCVPVIAAPTDKEAAFLSTTAQQKILGLITGRFPAASPAPVEIMEGWSPQEEAGVKAFLRESIVGGPDMVREKLQALVERTGANEIMVHSDFHRVDDAIRSYQIVSEVFA